jgi:tetratricopeptide (TPR) repeat protein
MKTGFALQSKAVIHDAIVCSMQMPFTRKASWIWSVFIFIVTSGIVLSFWWAHQNKFIECLQFQVIPSAPAAFECGNHYFGVYGSSGYDVSKAEYYFGKAVEIDPNTPDAWHQYARTAFLRGDFQTALYRINKQFEERGDELMASYYIRGLIEGYAKDYAAAENDFLKFLMWSPYNWAANNDLAWIYFAQGKFKEAKEQTEKGLAASPDNVWLLVTHGMSSYNLGDKRQAVEDLLKARDFVKKLTEATWSRAYPGNDPRVAGEGLAAFRQAIEDDLTLVYK